MRPRPAAGDLPADDVARESQWDPLLICVVAYILTAVGRVHQLFSALELLRPAILSGLGALALYLIDVSEERRARHILVAPTKYVLLLLVWITLSVPGALVPGNSFDLLVNNFAKTVLMFWVIAAAVRDVRDVERVAAAYLIGAAMYSAVVIMRFDLGEGADWRLGHLYYYDANDFATFAVTALPLGLYFLHSARRQLSRWLSAAGLGALALAFVNAGSRGGFIAIVAVGGYIVVRYTGIALRWRIWGTALVSVVVLATASDQYWQQMGTILSDTDYNRTEETGRMQIWSRGVGYMLDNPMFGVGAQNFQSAEGMLSPIAERQQIGVGVRWNAAHNSFVQAGAELGFPGLFLFIGALVSTFHVLSKSTAGARTTGADPKPAQLSQALTASLLGFVVGGFFLSFAYAEMLYTLVAIAVGLYKVQLRSHPTQHESG